MRVLCAAEKPSIAKGVASILGGQPSKRPGKSQYNPNYDFTFDFGTNSGLGQCDVTMTSVAGHLTDVEFNPPFNEWNSCAPAELFDKSVTALVKDSNKAMERNIATEARAAQYLVIWTDCDREGEHIGWEIQNVALVANPRIRVLRAVFSNVERIHVMGAARNLRPLDMRQVDAVRVRLELDLRTGAAFTRLQTRQLRGLHALLDNKTISYGSCQYPTLGFVVDRWRKVTDFRPQPYWSILVKCKHEGIEVSLSWRRGTLFDRHATISLYQLVTARGCLRVTKSTDKPKSKWRPLPLTTVELQRQGTRFLRMSSAAIMAHAEKLYQRGFLSYPRTETDQFDHGIDLRALVRKQESDRDWGTYVRFLLDGDPASGRPAGFRSPRRGTHNDGAHPPIHPIAHVTRDACESYDQWQVYNYVTRRFLACVSDDAKGRSAEVEFACAGETFSCHGLEVLERNYLDIYPFDKWTSTEGELPSFVVGQSIPMSSCLMNEGRTTPPSFLTEPELIALMNANGIGTDATMADHIDKIQVREYVSKICMGGGGSSGQAMFAPTRLGIALVTGFEQMGFDESLTKPHLRKATEHQLALIHAGEADRQTVLENLIADWRMAYIRAEGQISKLKEAVRAEFA
ncbi:DNA topoisomerase [Savitreella phatthalungensis]